MSSKDVEEVYEKMRKTGTATVENMVKWLKDAKILEKANQTEEQAAAMFKGAKKDSEVALGTFKQVVQDLAKEAKMSQEQVAQQMMQASHVLMEALVAAGQAFSATLTSAQDTSKKK